MLPKRYPQFKTQWIKAWIKERLLIKPKSTSIKRTMTVWLISSLEITFNSNSNMMTTVKKKRNLSLRVLEKHRHSDWVRHLRNSRTTMIKLFPLSPWNNQLISKTLLMKMAVASVEAQSPTKMNLLSIGISQQRWRLSQMHCYHTTESCAVQSFSTEDGNSEKKEWLNS